MPTIVDPTGFAFNGNGSRLYIAGASSNGADLVLEYRLTTNFDVSTAIGDDVFGVSDLDYIEAMGFDSNDDELILMGYSGTSTGKMIKYDCNIIT